MLFFHGPTNVRVTRIEEIEERFNVVITDRRDGVISFSVPKEDDIRWLKRRITGRIVSQCFEFEILHVEI